MATIGGISMNNSIILTEEQQKAVDVVIQRYLNGEKYSVIAGPAGTGKSEVVRFIAAKMEGLGLEEKDIVYTSFTGKATQVLQKKGNQNTLTLHKLLFVSHPKPNGGYVNIPVTSIPYRLVFIDEISMAPKSLIQRLASYPNVYVVCCGDDQQLPPINKNEDNHLLDHPHARLTKIMRQEEGSEIIELSRKVREKEFVDYFKGKEVQVIRKSELSTGMLQWADQILVATNETRKAINAQMRGLLGHGEDPEDGDKLICCRNYWEDECNGGNALVNGTIGYLKDGYKSFVMIPGQLNKMQCGCTRQVDIVNGTFVETDGEEYKDLRMDKNMIITGDKTLDWKTEYAISQSKIYKHLLPYEFTYGYAITVHRAQGSQWDKVLVIEENFPFNEEEHKRWLYTAVTRAAKKLVLVRPD